MELDMGISTPYNNKKNEQLSPFLSAKLSGNVLNRVFAQNCDLLVGRGRFESQCTGSNYMQDHQCGAPARS